MDPHRSNPFLPQPGPSMQPPDSQLPTQQAPQQLLYPYPPSSYNPQHVPGHSYGPNNPHLLPYLGSNNPHHYFPHPHYGPNPPNLPLNNQQIAPHCPLTGPNDGNTSNPLQNMFTSTPNNNNQNNNNQNNPQNTHTQNYPFYPPHPNFPPPPMAPPHNQSTTFNPNTFEMDQFNLPPPPVGDISDPEFAATLDQWRNLNFKHFLQFKQNERDVLQQRYQSQQHQQQQLQRLHLYQRQQILFEKQQKELENHTKNLKMGKKVKNVPITQKKNQKNHKNQNTSTNMVDNDDMNDNNDDEDYGNYGDGGREGEEEGRTHPVTIGREKYPLKMYKLLSNYSLFNIDRSQYFYELNRYVVWSRLVSDQLTSTKPDRYSRTSRQLVCSICLVPHSSPTDFEMNSAHMIAHVDYFQLCVNLCLNALTLLPLSYEHHNLNSYELIAELDDSIYNVEQIDFLQAGLHAVVNSPTYSPSFAVVDGGMDGDRDNDMDDKAMSKNNHIMKDATVSDSFDEGSSGRNVRSGEKIRQNERNVQNCQILSNLPNLPNLHNNLQNVQLDGEKSEQINNNDPIIIDTTEIKNSKLAFSPSQNHHHHHHHDGSNSITKGTLQEFIGSFSSPSCPVMICHICQTVTTHPLAIKLHTKYCRVVNKNMIATEDTQEQIRLQFATTDPNTHPIYPVSRLILHKLNSVPHSTMINTNSMFPGCRPFHFEVLDLAPHNSLNIFVNDVFSIRDVPDISNSFINKNSLDAISTKTMFNDVSKIIFTHTAPKITQIQPLRHYRFNKCNICECPPIEDNTTHMAAHNKYKMGLISPCTRLTHCCIACQLSFSSEHQYSVHINTIHAGNPLVLSPIEYVSIDKSLDSAAMCPKCYTVSTKKIVNDSTSAHHIAHDLFDQTMSDYRRYWTQNYQLPNSLDGFLTKADSFFQFWPTKRQDVSQISEESKDLTQVTTTDTGTSNNDAIKVGTTAKKTRGKTNHNVDEQKGAAAHTASKRVSKKQRVVVTVEDSNRNHNNNNNNNKNNDNKNITLDDISSHSCKPNLDLICYPCRLQFKYLIGLNRHVAECPVLNPPGMLKLRLLQLISGQNKREIDLSRIKELADARLHDPTFHSSVIALFNECYISSHQFICPICKFAIASSLFGQHIELHTQFYRHICTQVIPNFPCLPCQIVYEEVGELEAHLRDCHPLVDPLQYPLIYLQQHPPHLLQPSQLSSELQCESSDPDRKQSLLTAINVLRLQHGDNKAIDILSTATFNEIDPVTFGINTNLYTHLLSHHPVYLHIHGSSNPNRGKAKFNPYRMQAELISNPGVNISVLARWSKLYHTFHKYLPSPEMTFLPEFSIIGRPETHQRVERFQLATYLQGYLNSRLITAQPHGKSYLFEFNDILFPDTLLLDSENTNYYANASIPHQKTNSSSSNIGKKITPKSMVDSDVGFAQPMTILPPLPFQPTNQNHQTQPLQLAPPSIVPPPPSPFQAALTEATLDGTKSRYFEFWNEKMLRNFFDQYCALFFDKEFIKNQFSCPNLDDNVISPHVSKPAVKGLTKKEMKVELNKNNAKYISLEQIEEIYPEYLRKHKNKKTFYQIGSHTFLDFISQYRKHAIIYEKLIELGLMFVNNVYIHVSSVKQPVPHSQTERGMSLRSRGAEFQVAPFQQGQTQKVVFYDPRTQFLLSNGEIITLFELTCPCCYKVMSIHDILNPMSRHNLLHALYYTNSSDDDNNRASDGDEKNNMNEDDGHENNNETKPPKFDPKLEIFAPNLQSNPSNEHDQRDSIQTSIPSSSNSFNNNSAENLKFFKAFSGQNNSHHNSHHNPPQTPQPNPPPFNRPTNLKYPCHICQIDFPTAIQREKHDHEHLRSNNPKCWCSMSIPQKNLDSPVSQHNQGHDRYIALTKSISRHSASLSTSDALSNDLHNVHFENNSNSDQNNHKREELHRFESELMEYSLRKPLWSMACHSCKLAFETSSGLSSHWSRCGALLTPPFIKMQDMVVYFTSLLATVTAYPLAYTWCEAQNKFVYENGTEVENINGNSHPVVFDICSTHPFNRSAHPLFAKKLTKLLDFTQTDQTGNGNDVEGDASEQHGQFYSSHNVNNITKTTECNIIPLAQSKVILTQIGIPVVAADGRFLQSILITCPICTSTCCFQTFNRHVEAHREYFKTISRGEPHNSEKTCRKCLAEFSDYESVIRHRHFECVDPPANLVVFNLRFDPFGENSPLKQVNDIPEGAEELFAPLNRILFELHTPSNVGSKFSNKTGTIDDGKNLDVIYTELNEKGQENHVLRISSPPQITAQAPLISQDPSQINPLIRSNPQHHHPPIQFKQTTYHPTPMPPSHPLHLYPPIQQLPYDSMLLPPPPQFSHLPPPQQIHQTHPIVPQSQYNTTTRPHTQSTPLQCMLLLNPTSPSAPNSNSNDSSFYLTNHQGPPGQMQVISGNSITNSLGGNNNIGSNGSTRLNSAQNSNRTGLNGQSGLPSNGLNIISISTPPMLNTPPDNYQSNDKDFDNTLPSKPIQTQKNTVGNLFNAINNSSIKTSNLIPSYPPQPLYQSFIPQINTSSTAQLTNSTPSSRLESKTSGGTSEGESNREIDTDLKFPFFPAISPLPPIRQLSLPLLRRPVSTQLSHRTPRENDFKPGGVSVGAATRSIHQKALPTLKPPHQSHFPDPISPNLSSPRSSNVNKFPPVGTTGTTASHDLHQGSTGGQSQSGQLGSTTQTGRTQLGQTASTPQGGEQIRKLLNQVNDTVKHVHHPVNCPNLLRSDTPLSVGSMSSDISVTICMGELQIDPQLKNISENTTHNHDVVFVKNENKIVSFSPNNSNLSSPAMQHHFNPQNNAQSQLESRNVSPTFSTASKRQINQVLADNDDDIGIHHISSKPFNPSNSSYSVSSSLSNRSFRQKAGANGLVGLGFGQDVGMGFSASYNNSQQPQQSQQQQSNSQNQFKLVLPFGQSSSNGSNSGGVFLASQHLSPNNNSNIHNIHQNSMNNSSNNTNNTCFSPQNSFIGAHKHPASPQSYQNSDLSNSNSPRSILAASSSSRSKTTFPTGMTAAGLSKQSPIPGSVTGNISNFMNGQLQRPQYSQSVGDDAYGGKFQFPAQNSASKRNVNNQQPIFEHETIQEYQISPQQQQQQQQQQSQQLGQYSNQQPQQSHQFPPLLPASLILQSSGPFLNQSNEDNKQ